MSSTQESAGSSPPPLRYPESGEREGVRFGVRTAGAIIAVIVLTAAGLTAAIVLTHKPATPEPPKPAVPGQNFKPAAAASPAVEGSA